MSTARLYPLAALRALFSRRGGRGAAGSFRRPRLRVEVLEARDVPAAAGSLDPTFGVGGLVTTDFQTVGSPDPTFHPSDTGWAQAVQADGKIVVAGISYQTPDFLRTEAAVARYNRDGSPDVSFGTGGRVILDFGGLGSGTGVAVQADGKIVVSSFAAFPGTTGVDFAVERLNPDGTPDAGFGTAGRVFIDFGGHDDRSGGVAVQADGKIVVAGSTTFTAPGADFSTGDFAAARLNPDGSPDAGFGTGGKATVHAAGFVSGVYMAAHAGRVVMAGSMATSNGSDTAVTRLTAAGTPDTSFGPGGLRVIDFDDRTTTFQNDVPNGVAVQADGRTVLAGYSLQFTPGAGAGRADVTVARLNPDGTPDAGFDGDGRKTIDLGGSDTGAGVAVQADGNIVAAATTGSAMAVLRLTPGGGFDTGFGGGGVRTVDFGGNSSASAVAVQADGNIVVVGTATAGSTGPDFALARFVGNPNVTSLPNAVTGGFVTVESPTGTALDAVTALAPPPPDQRTGTGLPPTAGLPVGAFDFTVGGVAPGGAVEVVLVMPPGTQVDAYYKYDPARGMWSRFGSATIEDRNGDGTPDVVLRLTDGGLGDQDGQVNGVIVDPGAPAFVPTVHARIDVGPGAGPGPTNLAGQGMIAVAIFSTADFSAATVDIGSVRFAGAGAVQWFLRDVDGDGRPDLVLQFRIQDTNLRAVYQQLVAADVNADGVLDSTRETATVGLTGSTADGQQIEGSDTLDLFLSGKPLRDLLARLAATGAI